VVDLAGVEQAIQRDPATVRVGIDEARGALRAVALTLGSVALRGGGGVEVVCALLAVQAEEGDRPRLLVGEDVRGGAFGLVALAGEGPDLTAVGGVDVVDDFGVVGAEPGGSASRIATGLSSPCLWKMLL
jgi:hypothetical protein